jgi:hypothetical protein
MNSAAGDFHIHRFSSDDVAERDRLAFMRKVYGRVIVKHDIEPHPGSPFHCRSVLRRLPGLGIASTDCSGIHLEPRAAQTDSNDLVSHLPLAGKCLVRQFGRDAVVGAGVRRAACGRRVSNDRKVAWTYAGPDHRAVCPSRIRSGQASGNEDFGSPSVGSYAPG